MQTHLRHLVIAHAANKLLENCAINCKNLSWTKLILRFRNFGSGKWKLDSKPFRFQKKGKFRLELVPGSGPWTTLLSGDINSTIRSCMANPNFKAFSPAITYRDAVHHSGPIVKHKFTGGKRSWTLLLYGLAYFLPIGSDFTRFAPFC